MITVGSNWLPTDAAPPCTGQWLVFDSTDMQNHRAAKRLCAGCEFRAKCASVADGERARQGRPAGTWGGKLFGAAERERRDAA